MGLDAFLGQDDIKEKLIFQMELARKRESTLNHLLLCGPDGEGKAFLAKCIVDEMHMGLSDQEALSVGMPGQMSSILMNLHAGDALLIQHVDQLNRQCAAVLASSLKDFVMELTIGKGGGARRLTLPVQHFTLIGTAPHQSSVAEGLRRGLVIMDFHPYDHASLKALVLKSAMGDHPSLDSSGAAEIAKRSGGSLQAARTLAQQVKDYAIVNNHSTINDLIVLKATGFLNVETAPKDMSGISFELKCMDLLRQRGFEVKRTQRTSDGGIDLIAILNDPIMGGKFIVQCKDWTGPVGVTVVRDLYGVVHSEDANRGLLIATSSFTKEALDFAAGKRLELIDGARLDYLVAQRRPDKSP